MRLPIGGSLNFYLFLCAAHFASELDDASIPIRFGEIILMFLMRSKIETKFFVFSRESYNDDMMMKCSMVWVWVGCAGAVCEHLA